MAAILKADPDVSPVFRDLALLAARLAVGGFLIHGVWDNIVSTARMAEFARFLGAHGFPVPHLMAPLSVGAQFAAGVALMLGLLTRWAGLLTVANFIVALVMVDLALGVRGAYPSVSLVVLGLIFASFGGGELRSIRWCFAADAERLCQDGTEPPFHSLPNEALRTG